MCNARHILDYLEEVVNTVLSVLSELHCYPTSSPKHEIYGGGNRRQFKESKSLNNHTQSPEDGSRCGEGPGGG